MSLNDKVPIIFLLNLMVLNRLPGTQQVSTKCRMEGERRAQLGCKGKAVRLKETEAKSALSPGLQKSE